MLLYAILAFVGAYVLREQIAREFPDAELVSARAAISDYFRAMGEKVSRARAATAPAQSRGSQSAGSQSAGTLSVASELERLAALRDSGAITDEEYAAAKRELLGLARTPAG
jgi:hypothetical protein